MLFRSKLIFHMFGALAEFERNLIIERTRAGLAAARARGKKGGRPKALSKKERDIAVRLYNDRKNSIKEICETLKISKPTLYNSLHRAKGLLWVMVPFSYPAKPLPIFNSKTLFYLVPST